MEQIKRQVAYKVRLNDLASGQYVRQDGEWEPNHIKTPDGRTFSRANVIAVIASEPMKQGNYHSFILDDGSAQLPVRIFDDLKTDISLGDVALIIGRPREFGGEIYLAPEIIKKIENKRWIEYRKLELSSLPKSPMEEEVKKTPKVEVETIPQEIKTSKDTNMKEIKADNPADEILNLIREFDKGDGADTEEVIEATNIKDAEELIDNLLKEGEIFEITSGRLKVLE